MSNVLEVISKLKLKNSKNHFSILVLYLSAYSCTGICEMSTFETTCKTGCAVTSRLLTRGHYLVKNSFCYLIQWNLRVKFEGVG